jgi:chemotaxis protein CheD
VSDERIVVGVGRLAVHRAPATLVTLALGSCVAILLHDRESGAGALAHVLLPSPGPEGPRERAGRYASSAPGAMLTALRVLGVPARRTTARLVGGASMFASLSAPGAIQVGERNVVAAREALRLAGVALVGESVGGSYGRNVEFHLPSGRVLITSYAHDPETL